MHDTYRLRNQKIIATKVPISMTTIGTIIARSGTPSSSFWNSLFSCPWLERVCVAVDEVPAVCIAEVVCSFVVVSVLPVVVVDVVVVVSVLTVELVVVVFASVT